MLLFLYFSVKKKLAIKHIVFKDYNILKANLKFKMTFFQKSKNEKPNSSYEWAVVIEIDKYAIANKRLNSINF
jgi:hypothetical protein